MRLSPAVYIGAAILLLPGLLPAEQAGGGPDAAEVERHLHALEGNAHDPASIVFFRDTGFGRAWPVVQNSDADSRLRYLLLMRYLNCPAPEAKAELLRHRGQDVLRVALATYWPIEVLPLREDGAYQWATISSGYDPGTRTLTNNIRMSMDCRYSKGAIVHFEQFPTCVVSDGGPGRASWSYRGDYPWDSIIRQVMSEPIKTTWGGWVPVEFPEMRGTGMTPSQPALLRRWRMAILASRDVHKSGVDDLVLMALQKNRQIETLDRAQVELVFGEQELAALVGGKSPRRDFANRADALVILKLENREGTNSLKCAVSDCRTGTLLNRSFFGWPFPKVDACAEQIARVTLATLARFPEGVKQVVGVSPLRCRNLSFDYDHFQTAFTRLIQFGLQKHPGLAVVDIEEAHLLRAELQESGSARESVPTPVYLEGEFEVKTLPSRGQAVDFSLRILGNDAKTRTTGKTGVPMDAVPEYLGRTLPGEVVARGSGTAGDSGTLDPHREFALLAAQAEEWERQGEWRTAVEMREAALVIKPDAVQERIKLAMRHNDPLQRRIHVEYLIRHRQVERGQALTLFEAATLPVAPEPLIFFSDELQALLRRAHEQKIGDMVRVFPLILGLQPSAASAADEEAWRQTLLRLILREDLKMQTQILKGIASGPESPPLAVAVASYLLDPTAPLLNPSAISANLRFVAHRAHPPTPTTLEWLRKSDLPIERFFAWQADAINTNLPLKGRYLAAQKATGLLNDRKDWFRYPADQSVLGTHYEISRSFESLIRTISCELFPAPTGFDHFPVQYPAPGFPAPKPRDKPTMEREKVSVSIRRVTGELVPFQTYRAWSPKEPERGASFNLPMMLNCGTFDVFWSESNLLLHRDRGVLTEVLVNFAPGLSDVKWDGQFLWIGTVKAGIWVADRQGRILTHIGETNGLPEVVQSVGYPGKNTPWNLLLEPVSTGQVVAVGRMKNPSVPDSPLRSWCATVCWNGRKAFVDIFLEARRTITDTEKAETVWQDPQMSFSPYWIRMGHEAKTDKDYVYVGRESDFDRWRPMRIPPLRVDWRTRQVTVDSSPPKPLPRPLPADYEPLRAELEGDFWDEGHTPALEWAVSALLGPICWLPRSGEFFRILLKQPGEPELPPLYVVAEKGDLEKVNLLLQKGAVVDLGHHLTPLGWAAARGHADVAKVLIEKGADVNFHGHLPAGPVLLAQQPLHCAIRGAARPRQGEIVRMLLDKGANVNARDHEGMTPLHLACVWGHYREAEALVNAKADLNLQEHWGNRTPLHIACQGGLTNLTALLLAHGADMNQKDKWGKTALHHAAAGGHAALVEPLVSAGADIEARDDLGDTPLHKAVWMNRKAAIEALIKHGADVRAKDGAGVTPLQWAVELEFISLESLLLPKG